MVKHISSFHGVTLDAETFALLSDNLIALCGEWIRNNLDTSGTDTSILYDAVNASTLENERIGRDLKHKQTPLLGDLYEQEDRLEYELEHFWGVYRRIADEFLKSFRKVDLSLLPFEYEATTSSFAVDVWSSYFKREVCEILCFDSRFALLVMKSVSHPETYLETTNELDDILIMRYGITTA